MWHVHSFSVGLTHRSACRSVAGARSRLLVAAVVARRVHDGGRIAQRLLDGIVQPEGNAIAHKPAWEAFCQRRGRCGRHGIGLTADARSGFCSGCIKSTTGLTFILQAFPCFHTNKRRYCAACVCVRVCANSHDYASGDAGTGDARCGEACVLACVPFAGGMTSTTTLPTACPPSRHRIASTAAANGKRL